MWPPQSATAHNFVLPAAFAFFHLALVAADMAARPAADILRLGFADFPFSFAHRARCAAPIAARAAADIFLRPFRLYWRLSAISPPRIWVKRLSRETIFSRSASACFSWVTPRLFDMLMGWVRIMIGDTTVKISA